MSKVKFMKIGNLSYFLIAIYEKYQGKGYGKIMIRYIIENFKDKCEILFVGTGSSNKTISFYKGCGFVYSHTMNG